jgi:hypothetical protein
VLAFLLLSAACIAVHGLNRRDNASAETIQGLFIAAERLDFGEVWEQHEFSWTLPIENRSDNDVRILGFSCCSGRVESMPPDLTIPAHGREDVSLTIDLTGRTTRETKSYLPEGSGTRSPARNDLLPLKFELGIRPRIEGAPDEGLAWLLSGRVRRVLGLAPAVLDFDTSLTRGQTFVPRVVIVTQHRSLASLCCHCDPSYGSAVLRDASSRLEICPSQSLPIGPFAFDVILQGTTSQGEKLPPLRLPVRGQVLHDVEPIPSSLFLGAAFAGQTLTVNLILRSRTGRPFVVEDIHSSNPDLTVDAIPQTSLTTWTYCISQRVRGEGAQTRRIDFVVRSDGDDLGIIPVNVSFYARGGAKAD